MTKLKEIIKKSHYSCSVPFVQADVRLDTGIVYPCSKYKEPLGALTKSFEVIWHGKRFDNLRKKMINGEKIDQCKTCNDCQDTFTYREYKNNQYNEAGYTDIELTGNYKLKSLNLAVSNLCNLACRMCHPSASSRLNAMTTKELLPFFGKKQNYKANHEQKINRIIDSLTDLEHITISGGEPMIDPGVELFVTELLKRSKTVKSITFVSNFNIINYKILDLIKSRSIKLTLTVSIDGSKKLNDYIRHGCNYDLIVSNLIKVVEKYNCAIVLSTTINAYNIPFINETLASFHTLETTINKKISHIIPSAVTNPYVDPAVYNEDQRKEFKNDILKNTTKYSIPGSEDYRNTALTLLDNDHHRHWGEFVTFTKEFDNVTNTNIHDVFPFKIY